jgi:hypothetical protein
MANVKKAGLFRKDETRQKHLTVIMNWSRVELVSLCPIFLESATVKTDDNVFIAGLTGGMRYEAEIGLYQPITAKN